MRDVRKVKQSKATQTHYCDECREPIDPGETYTLCREVFHPSGNRKFKIHPHCLACLQAEQRAMKDQ